MLPGHPSHLQLQLGRPVHGHTGAAVIGHRRIRPIGGQRQPLGQPGQRITPVGQLGGDAAAGIGQITELGALPQRVIDILHRQRRPARGPPLTPGGISHPQITYQHGDRPAVSGDMMRHRHQHMLLLAEAQQLCPQRDLGRQIKAVTRHRADGLFQPVCRPAGGLNNLPAEAGPLNRDDHLSRCSLDRLQQRAQTLMTGHHISQRRPQRLSIQPAAQPHRRRQVVHR
ncbi:hypothetical protein LAUMK13_03006 [Mycobacterium innocens]|uniref:Uncharacterized protein n=1 Tax=Mycobacterium innocens TaxID=2341083 RepID=A0A498Q646_9MYCO|nr:hypothetical protein LAUMK13_03006 [Mycobacterium innocens]